MYLGGGQCMFPFTFREFVNVCKTALDLNGRVINSDQLEYQESLDINFREMTERLAEIFGEPVGRRQCVTIISVSMSLM